MRLVRLRSEIDFDGWRRAARQLVAEGIAPEHVEWMVGSAESLLAGNVAGTSPRGPSGNLTVPRAFVALAESVILHEDPQRFALLYRLLWRLKLEPRLMDVASDADLVRARAMEQAVHREIHKTHAFVRFRAIASDVGEVLVAWFEPTHHTLEAAAPFFVRRFTALRWSILTPRVSAHWNLKELTFGAGADRRDAPAEDQLEDLWRTYYASIFNPARLKSGTMQAHMPRKYWRNMPEAELIGELIARAPNDTGAMIAEEPSEGAVRQPRLHGTRAKRPACGTPSGKPEDSLQAVRIEAHGCTACPLYAAATQVVFGDGPTRATAMFVGEQPGDQEDLAGRPFVGPAGQLFDRALAAAGIDRAGIYVTNAVKHFKFELRGKRRLHKTPGQLEIEACRPWLEREILLVQPRLIVALGATAAHSVLGRPTAIQRNRSKLMRVSNETQVLVTVHPSYLLRVPDEQQALEYSRFVEDLKLARAAM